MCPKAFSRRAALVASAAALALSTSQAWAQARVHIAIASQSVEGALTQLARQTGVNIVFEARVVEGYRAAGLDGVLTPEEAARRLIAQTGLQIVSDGAGGLVVRELPRSPAKPLKVSADTQAPAVSSAPAPVAVQPPPSSALEEVVVTATRQTSTVNKVALSVSAVTQKSLDQQGIRNVADLSTQVPGFTFRVAGGDNNPQLTLRGIGGNTIAGTSGSAATTGVYLDDQPLQKRNANGQVAGSGSPVPLLYDLERIEVLRGPQGTLYGGSSEGGTIRFIMPSPSLTTYSGQARVGWSTMTGGGMGNEEGFALGGPIVRDKLGFRIAGYRQDRPGWVDNYSEADGHQFASNVNWGTDYSLRAALLWQVTPDFKASVSVFNQMNYDNDTSTVRTSSPATNIPVKTFANCGYVMPAGTTSAQAASALAAMGKTGCGAATTTGLNIGAAGAALPVNGVSFSFPATSFGGYSIPAQTWYGNGNGAATGVYLTPTNVQYMPSPRRTLLTTPSITLDYNWGDKLDFKSITAYTDDRTSGLVFQGGSGVINRTSVLPNYSAQPCPSGAGLVTPIILTGAQTAGNGCTISPQYLALGSTPGVAANGAGIGPVDTLSYFFYNNRRGQTTQEFRVSTTDPSWRLQFVVGAFIEHENNHVNSGANYNEGQFLYQLRGYPEPWFAGGQEPAPFEQTPGNGLYDVATRDTDITEDEQSIFGEFTFAVIPDKLKITAGVRAVNYVQQYYQSYGGTVAGVPAGFVGTSSAGAAQAVTIATPAGTATSQLETNPNSTSEFPTNYAACPASLKNAVTQAQQLAYGAAGCPYSYTAARLKENPVTPKFGISYQISPGDLIYATYAEGYRPGGINPPVPPIMCAQDFANLGITASPEAYQPDYVKSTEVGGKFRLFNGQAQVNAAAFHIEWDNVQFVETLPLCLNTYIANAAKAASDGAELQLSARSHGFTFNGNLSYDNARYTATSYGPVNAQTGARAILVNKGDNLGVPDWTGNVGLQYDTVIVQIPAYARMDYIYTGKYMRTTSAGTSSYLAAITPNFINGNETHIVNARVGLYYKDLEIAGYVKNLFNSQEWINKTEGTGYYWFTGNKVTPRLVGLQMNYRF